MITQDIQEILLSEDQIAERCREPVSYTHLTLPTIA